jgi:hypothetical protein
MNMLRDEDFPLEETPALRGYSFVVLNCIAEHSPIAEDRSTAAQLLRRDIFDEDWEIEYRNRARAGLSIIDGGRCR